MPQDTILFLKELLNHTGERPGMPRISSLTERTETVSETTREEREREKKTGMQLAVMNDDELGASYQSLYTTLTEYSRMFYTILPCSVPFQNVPLPCHMTWWKVPKVP